MDLSTKKSSVSKKLLESHIQEAVIAWCRNHEHEYEGLELMHHIPNGGSRNIIEATKLKRMGVLSGIPDLFLPVCTSGYCGLYIELKRSHAEEKALNKKLKNLNTVDHQSRVILYLREMGYRVEVTSDFAQTVDLIKQYLPKSL